MISVIIPVYNDAAGLQKCLKALTEQYKAGEFEILVIDNDSEEDIKGVAIQFSNVKYLHEKKIGSYAARNCGIRCAKGDIIAFTDADCIPDEDWLVNAADFLINHEECDAIGGKIEIFTKSGSPNPFEMFDRVFAFQQKSSIQKYNYSVTANLITRKETIKKNGYFNDDLKSGGDAEWCQRLVSGGGMLCYAPDVTIKHPATSSLRKFIKKFKRVAGGRIQREKPSIYQILRISYHHLLSIKETFKKIKNSSSVDGTFNITAVFVIYLIKIFVYIMTYFITYLGVNPARE